MSPEAWAFFTANSLGILTLVGTQIDGRKKAKKSDEKLDEAIQNTVPIKNGTIPALTRDMAFIKDLVISLDRRMSRFEEKSRE